MRRANSTEARPRRIGVVVSLFIHVLVIVLIIVQVDAAQRGTKEPAPRRTVIVSLAPPAPAAAPVTPPKPPEPPKEEITPEPTPTPARPPKESVPKPAASQPPVTSNAAADVEAPPPPPELSLEESLYGRIHDNWLEPARAPPIFSCRIRIDYLAGGRIVSVKFMQGCGNYELDESVKKAVWKTQPLPMPETQAASGSIEIDFVP